MDILLSAKKHLDTITRLGKLEHSKFAKIEAVTVINSAEETVEIYTDLVFGDYRKVDGLNGLTAALLVFRHHLLCYCGGVEMTESGEEDSYIEELGGRLQKLYKYYIQQ